MSKLDQVSRSKLLKLARDAIHQHLIDGTSPATSGSEFGTSCQTGAFVTLRKEGKLRGCIGCLSGAKPLSQTVMDCAVSSAVHDPRFPPLQLGELEQVDIEISLISATRRINGIEEFRLGEHGVVVSAGRKRGLLLPQVAMEHSWDRETFLKHACLKAGLAPDAWKKKARLEVFSAEVFAETGRHPPPDLC